MRRATSTGSKRRPTSATDKDMLLVHVALDLPKFGAEGMTARNCDS
jgi:hypothetical protein